MWSLTRRLGKLWPGSDRRWEIRRPHVKRWVTEHSFALPVQ